MAQFALPNEHDFADYNMYIQRKSRFGFTVPEGELKEALLGLYNDEARHLMGRRALILYSEYQSVQYLSHTSEESAAERLDSAIVRRIRNFKHKQYKPARWIKATRQTVAETDITLSIVLDSRTHEQLSDSMYDGLDQAKFGRRAIAASLTIADRDIAQTPEARRAASRELRDVLWSDDPVEVPPSEFSPGKNQTAYVTGIDWSSRITKQSYIA